MKKLILTLIFAVSSIMGFDFDQSNRVVVINKSGFDIKHYINLKDCDKILDERFFHICYNYKTNTSIATWYYLLGNNVDKVNIKKRARFHGDSKLPYRHRVSNKDYTGSNYDRGHLAFDSGFDWRDDALYSTYVMSNVVPQKHSINAGAWAIAEHEAINLAKEYGKVYVVDLVDFSYSNETIGHRHKIKVPSTFIKLIIDKDGNLLKRFIIRQPLK